MAERIKKETKRESTTEAETEENVTIVYERIKITQDDLRSRMRRL